MSENPIKPVAKEDWPPSDAKSVKTTTKTVKVTRGKFMSDSDEAGIFDTGQQTVTPGYRPKRGRFMES